VTISFESSGNFKKTEAWLAKMINGDIYAGLERYGQEGVNALAAATPRDEGDTAAGWWLCPRSGLYQSCPSTDI
jgi:hypothetical protein